MTPQFNKNQNAFPHSVSESENPVVDTSSVEREETGNKRLMAFVIILAVLVVALGVSLLTYLTQGSSGAQDSQSVEITAAQTYLSNHDDEPAAYERLALAQMGTGDEKGALQTLSDGIRKTGAASLQVTLGDVLRGTGEHEQAITAYDKAELYRLETLGLRSADSTSTTELDESYHDTYLSHVYYGRALSEAAIDKQEAAREDLERATKLSPESATIWTALGNLCLEAGDRESAIGAYDNALKYVPDYQEALSGLNRAQGGK